MRYRHDPEGGTAPVDPAPGERMLGSWVCWDVGRRFGVLLDALAMADQVGKGDKPFAPWDSEGFAVAFEPDGVTIASNFGDPDSTVYPVDAVRAALEDYWAFLVALPEREGQRRFRPDLAEWEADLLQWEQTWQLRHPYRGRLGIPLEGPA
ncbi:hypothetical protein [Glycomyces albidus]|jgi:hypothetical protein|uniref:Uncharacterized protein n=1 Tax=Glycomyces albidus TaxID=2656774 RepID=A0A6L5GGT1_9ACTN|nr:hypothetical protein [Glycomyces albidus]MQM28902.1 hypothetical protein [Glycomyces albidus]